MTDVQRPPQGRIPYRLLSLLISALLIAVGIAITYHRVNWREVTAVWAHLDVPLVAAAAVVYWLQYPVNSLRIQKVIIWTTGCSPSDAPSLKFLFKMTCGGGFVAVAAPLGIAGDAAKIAALRLFGNLSITDAARAALFDRVVGMQYLAIIGLAMTPVLIAAGVDWGIVITQLVLFGGLIAGVGLLLVFPRALAWFGNDFINRIARVFAGYRALLHPQRLPVQVIIALLNFLFAWGSLYLLLRAARLDSNVWIVAAFIPLLQLVNGLPFLYMGWGGRELVMATTLGVASNLTANETLAISIALGGVMIVTGAFNGVFLLGDWRRSSGSVRNGNMPDTPAGQVRAPAPGQIDPA